MELGIGVLSLLWVIGVLTLQRIDAISNDFNKSLSVYLSTIDGVVHTDQLAVNSAKPNKALKIYLDHLISSSDRKDKGGLAKTLKFFKAQQITQALYESLLILITFMIPLVYLLDFHELSFSRHVSKNEFLLLAIFIFTLASLFIHKLLDYLAGHYYPISYVTKR